LLWGPDDDLALRRAATDANKRRLEELFRYGRDGVNCRRETLLRLLNYEGAGEKPETDCCDVCNGKTQAGLREEESVLGFFRRNRRVYTLEEAVPVLAAAESVRWSAEDVKAVIRRLVRTGALKRIKHFPWKNKLTVSLPL
jgi:ATP-dependent DNA helicase RecQ